MLRPRTEVAALLLLVGENSKIVQERSVNSRIQALLDTSRYVLARSAAASGGENLRESLVSKTIGEVAEWPIAPVC
jgi:hypothetical protein